MNKKKLLPKLYASFAALCLIVLMIIPSFSKKPINSVAEAAGPIFDVLGYAWSYHPHEQADAYDGHNNVGSIGSGPLGTQGFGWISMNGTNPDAGGGNYKVQIDPATGKFSGYAWSENGGWVNFAPAAPYPSAAGTTAQSAAVDPTCLADKTRTCDVKGWIRFVEGTTGNSSWDGWVSMDIFNDSTAASAYNLPTASVTKGVKLLPESGGYRPMDGYAWGDDLAGIIGFSKAKVKIEQVDLCTNIDGVQPIVPTGMTKDTAGNTPGLCGIFGCTDKTATNYVKGATIDDGSCIPVGDPVCPDGTLAPDGNPKLCPESPTCTPTSPTYNPVFKDCRECHPGVTGYNTTTGLCTTQPPTCSDGSPVPANGVCPGTSGEDQCKNVEGFQGTVVAPYTQVIQAGVKNCYIIGCTDPHANNQTPGATMQDNPSSCIYDQGVEICGNKKDDDGDGQTDEGCPHVPTAPKKPIYIET